MDTLQSVVDKVRPEMSPDLAWAIIVLLALVLVWALVRYINRLDTILDRLDTAIESHAKILINLDNGKQDHERRITKLEDTNKRTRR